LRLGHDPAWMETTPLDIATMTWLSLGFGLGLVHAFDADHVMALSVFASKGRNASDGVRAGLRWALGHGLVLVGVGCGLLFLGRMIPVDVALAAERGVGLLMVALGVWVWLELVRHRGHLHFHDHGDIPPHAHWHSHRGHSHRDDARSHHEDRSEQTDTATHGHDHGPFFVGGLHGLAGSAPILAVLPAAAKSPLLGVGYLLIFAVGVSLAMATVSGVFGHVVGRFHAHGDERGLTAVRGLSASGSIALGLWMILPMQWALG
jgi:ABC-type nickel/cobalt efflux system permease component RcnA